MLTLIEVAFQMEEPKVPIQFQKKELGVGIESRESTDRSLALESEQWVFDSKMNLSFFS